MMEVDHQTVCFAAGVGALVTLLRFEPAPHTRRARLMSELQSELYTVAHLIKYVSEEEMYPYRIVFNNMEKTLDTISEQEEGSSYSDILISLILFCIEELPINTKIRSRYDKLAGCFPETDRYDTIRKGHRVFERMCAEIKIANAVGE